MIGKAGIPAVFLALALASVAPAAVDPSASLRADVETLAAEKMDGRLTGTKGEQRAARHIVERLKAAGWGPLPGLDGFRRPFDFTAGTRDGGSSLVLDAGPGKRASKWRGVDQVRALSFSDDAEVSGPVVFAGYGLTVPDNQELDYDSYATLDVEDKIVLVLRYSPEDVEDEMRSNLARYSGLRYKAMSARDLGAKAIVVVTGPRSPHAGETVAMSFDATLGGSGIAAVSIGGGVAREILGHAEGKDLEQLQQELDSGNPHVAGFEIPGVTLTLDLRVERERRTGHNLLAYLPGAGDAAGRRTVVLGAHYDHLGRGLHGNSRAGREEVGKVHRGADDNASGVATLIEIASRLPATEHRPPVVLAFWSGEELGLLGSTDFIERLPVPLDRIAAYLNFDMVGRMKDNRLNLQGVASSTAWPGLIERANVAVGFDVHTQGDPYLPTDASVFYRAGVPVLSFFTGSHPDYHRPSDTPARINYEGMARLARFAELIAARIGKRDEPLDYVEVERKSRAAGDRAGLRAYTGTIPDYATEVEGVRLSGVVGGGPAERCGLREGDVIVELAGRVIANIYDYTYALDSVKIDRPVTLVFVRDGRRQTVEITPSARP